jgi:hypothetical protein
MSSSPIPTRTGSFRSSDPNSQVNGNSTTQQLPKPSIPPPSVPGRPPPIGFNPSVLPLSAEAQIEPPNSLPYPLVSPLYPAPNSFDSSNVSPTTPNSAGLVSDQSQSLHASTTNVSSSSSSTSSSTTQSLHSPNDNHSPVNGQLKPPKPLLPRKPVNGLVAQHINKFETANGGKQVEDLADQSDDQASPNLLSRAAANSQEVTFL